ncbi:MAG: GntR family transcriptional regulator [Candidatus Promineifilaceae bacterium]|nr:GntR family transcriptional regulator [Candidatus Promineifilaceae bacterium]
MLKRSPSLTDQAKAHIKEQILNHEFADGRIPSESELANELGVSRTTIRDAMSRLENEGVVFRRQGSGTYVNEPGLQIKSRLEEIWSYEAVLEAHGYTPSTQVLAAYVEKPAQEIVNALNLGVGETILVIKKLFTEDSIPVIYTENRIPTRICDSDLDLDDFRDPIYQVLDERCQQRLNYYLSDIIPSSANEQLAKLLDITQGTALISFQETGYNDENEPILWARSYFRDDLLRFRMIRRGISRG